MADGAILYDGVTATPHLVSPEAENGQLVLVTDVGERLSVDPSLLVRLDGGGSALRLGRRDRPGWRLTVAGPVDPAIAALLPDRERYGAWIDRVGLFWAAAAFAVVAGLVVAAGYSAPAWLAPLVPSSWERDLGTALVGDFGDNRCSSRDGDRALATLVRRVAPDAFAAGPGQVKATALDIGIFNAAALPGGQIIVFRGALAESGNAEAMAGIIAHEIAHVRRRHVTQALIRELGIGALIRLFAGGIGADAQMLIGLSYTRANEAEADEDAIAMLKNAGIDPRPTAALFSQLAKVEDEDRMLDAEFLASHPGTRSRAAKFAASYDKRRPYRPALSQQEWDALADICWKRPAKT